MRSLICILFLVLSSYAFIDYIAEIDVE